MGPSRSARRGSGGDSRHSRRTRCSSARLSATSGRIDCLRLIVLRQRHLGRRGMAAVRLAIQLAGKCGRSRTLRPEQHLAADRRCFAMLAHRGTSIDFVERRRHGGDVAAMAVDEQEALEAVLHQRPHDILHNGDQGGGPQRNGAGKSKMVLRHADGERRRHEAADFVADTLRDELRIQMIGADQPVRPMLLGRPDRDDDATRGAEVFLDLMPGGQSELHGLSPDARCILQCLRGALFPPAGGQAAARPAVVSLRLLPSIASQPCATA